MTEAYEIMNGMWTGGKLVCVTIWELADNQKTVFLHTTINEQWTSQDAEKAKRIFKNTDKQSKKKPVHPMFKLTEEKST